MSAADWLTAIGDGAATAGAGTVIAMAAGGITRAIEAAPTSWHRWLTWLAGVAVLSGAAAVAVAVFGAHPAAVGSGVVGVVLLTHFRAYAGDEGEAQATAGPDDDPALETPNTPPARGTVDG